MKVFSVQNNYVNKINDQNRRMQRVAFKGQLTADALKQVKYPSCSFEWVDAFRHILNAVINEPGFRTSNSWLLNELIKNSDLDFKIESFIFNNIKNKIYSEENRVLAWDGNNPAIILGRDVFCFHPQSFIQFSDKKNFAQFGFDDIYNGKNFLNFYKDNGMYIDYHKNGGIRKLMPLTGKIKFYKPNGSRDYFAEIRNFFVDI